jgi:glycosyltransferase involved in cell wall biosynthesis
MKILFVCQYFYPEQFRINDICFSLAKQGHDITVLTGLPNYPQGRVPSEYRWFRKRREQINGVKIIRATLFGRGKSKIRLALNYCSFAFFASIKALFLKERYDVVFVYQLSPVTMAIPAILYKWRTGCKIGLYCNDLWPESVQAVGIKRNSLIFRFAYFLSRWIYLKADKIAISSRLFTKYFAEVLKIAGDQIYLPAYAEGIFNDIKRTDNKKQKGQIDLLFAGNIGKMQSVETIIKAANMLKEEQNIIFHIVGDGSALSDCIALTKQFGLENTVKFYGQKPLAEMPDFYNMADAFLVTLNANEIVSYTLPNKVQSYMAAGKPILGAIDGETRNVIKEAGCGLCCEAENHEGLAKIIQQFASYDKERHMVYGEKGKEYYNKYFAKEAFFTRFIKILEDLIDQKERD